MAECLRNPKFLRGCCMEIPWLGLQVFYLCIRKILAPPGGYFSAKKEVTASHEIKICIALLLLK